ncbi:MAG: hypothetical protein FWE45_02740 [Firmicutes bacterium]|nr:hypothetical protein [Bacillota bacterium]
METKLTDEQRRQMEYLAIARSYLFDRSIRIDSSRKRESDVLEYLVSLGFLDKHENAHNTKVDIYSINEKGRAYLAGLELSEKEKKIQKKSETIWNSVNSAIALLALVVAIVAFFI